MGHDYLLEAKINLRHYPDLELSFYKQGNVITFSNLYSNALLFIYYLLKFGIVTDISESEYRALKKIYNKYLDRIEYSDLYAFEQILKNAQYHCDVRIQILGQGLSSHGANDYFILLILKYLTMHHIKYQFIVSLEDLSVITFFETHQGTIPHIKTHNHENSFENLLSLVHNNLISKSHAEDLINLFYLPHVQLLTYFVRNEKNAIFLFSHAPIDLNMIQILCQFFYIVYRDNSMHELINTLHQLNDTFIYYMRHYLLNDLIQTSDLSLNKQNFSNPLLNFISNRNEDKLHVLKHHINYQILYVHTFSTPDSDKKKHLYSRNLQSMIGKGRSNSQGWSRFFINTKSSDETHVVSSKISCI